MSTRQTASIIIPTFNRANLVGRAIESAISQTYPCEIIVCDHGSTDNTSDVVARYQDKVRYIHRIEDKGPIVCWKDALENATGEIVHFTYDDDWIEPTFMEKTIALLNEDVGFVYSNVAVHYEGSDKKAIGFKHPHGIGNMKDIARYLLESPLPISPGCAIFRRKDALKNLVLEIPNSKGMYGDNSGVGQDVLLFLVTSLDYRYYAHLDEPLACFLAHENSITTKANRIGTSPDLANAYTNAKQCYFNLPGSIPRPTKLQSFIFDLGWGYRSGTFRKTLRHWLKYGRFWRQRRLV